MGDDGDGKRNGHEPAGPAVGDARGWRLLVLGLLVVALCTEIADHVFSGTHASEVTHDFSGAGRDVQAKVTHILYHIQESKPYLEGLLRSGSGELFMAELRRRVAEELAPELSASIEGVPADYLANHVACDFAETVRWWMRNPHYAPEEVCRFFLATTRL